MSPAEVRRHLGDRVYETIIPRNVRLSEAPSHGKPISSYSPDSTGAAAYAALAQELRTRDGRIEPPAAGEEPMMAWRRDRSTGAIPGPGSWSRIAHPAAQPRTRRDHRDLDRARPPEPASAPQALRRGRPGLPDRRASRSTASSSRSWSPRPSTVTSLWPASAASEPRRLPASNASRRSFANWPIATSSSSRWSRTSSARISIRSRRPRPIGSSSTTSASARTMSRAGSVALDRPWRTRFVFSTWHPVSRRRSRDGRLTEGHGRALGGLAPELQDRVLDSVIGQELSVRQTEELVRRLREPKPEPPGRSRGPVDRRPRACRGRPAPGAGNQGQPGPVATWAAGSSSSTTATKSSGVSTSA